MAEFGRVEGIESEAALVAADSPHRERITIGPFDERFTPGKRYGLILMLDVLEHLPAPEQALTHALRLLEPDGIILITVPAFPVLWTAHDDLNHHLRRYTRASLRALAERSGLELRACEYAYHWLFPVKLAVRLKEAILGSRPRPPGIPSEPINTILYRMLRLERTLLGKLDLPLGSALIAVGSAAGHPSAPPARPVS
jgi:SAM-dependent methyltransferase